MSRTYHTLQGKLAQLIRQYRQTDPKKGWVCDLTVPYLLDLLEQQQGRCAVTGLTLDLDSYSHKLNSLSIDRIDNNQGHTQSNVQFVCLGINLMRNDATIAELEMFLTQVSLSMHERNH